jgi:hypothetical protein
MASEPFGVKSHRAGRLRATSGFFFFIPLLARFVAGNTSSGGTYREDCFGTWVLVGSVCCRPKYFHVIVREEKVKHDRTQKGVYVN